MMFLNKYLSSLMMHVYESLYNLINRYHKLALQTKFFDYALAKDGPITIQDSAKKNLIPFLNSQII